MNIEAFKKWPRKGQPSTHQRGRMRVMILWF